MLFGRDDDEPQGPNVPGNLTPLGLGSRDARDYDPPPGDKVENTDELPNLLDRKQETHWATERYETPQFANIKDGTGVYLDAGSPVIARALRIWTPNPGWTVELYVANSPAPASVEDWTPVGGGRVSRSPQTFGLDTGGHSFQYYLVWITELTDGPNGRHSAGISELRLLG
jgi:hypothetical protein